ncbi:hypothetical protein EDD38_3166 [Kitasatospora cineracea]|uniref:Uncharacterized protein n=1 Tax=Kitasatospora cineracea TaxID=88074 RepID=A0A3N4RN26_9ACTN|nr:hypothetical protein EDD38_3166 [Kitasatospora cineracea]
MSALAPGLSPADGGVVVAGRSARAVRRAGWLRPQVLFLGCGLVLLPWSALLALLPGGRPWAVLDLVESAALAAAAACLRQGRSPFWPAGLAGALLVTDAGCDLATAAGGSEWLVALLMAGCAELPLAAACWSAAVRPGAVRAGSASDGPVGAGGGPVQVAGRWRRFRAFRMFGAFRPCAVAPAPVGSPPTGFLRKGVSVQTIQLTARSTGIVSASPADRMYTGMSSRLRVTATGSGPDGGPTATATGRSVSALPAATAAGIRRPDHPARSNDRAPNAGSRPRTCPGRAHRAASAALRAAAASSRRNPGLRRPAAARPTCFRELRSRKLRQNTAGSPRRSAPGG